MRPKNGLYLALISVHGLIRGHDLELGRDADTGGQTLYVLELAHALANHPSVARVDLFTRRVIDPAVSSDYAVPHEILTDKLNIIRIDAGPESYLPKEQLWDVLDMFSDNMMAFFREQGLFPDLLHSHYADAGYVGTHLANQTAIPLLFTGHSLGRVKRSRLLASGLNSQQIEDLYQISRRIEAEENVLAIAQRVITSTSQEIEKQYELYDYYQPEQMRILPPGTDLSLFKPPLHLEVNQLQQNEELSSALFARLTQHLTHPNKPIILALSRPDKRKNIKALIDAYGQCEACQARANLMIIAGNRDDIEDLEEGAQEVFQELLFAVDRYDLYGKVTLPKHHQRHEVADIYRIAAATRGVFVNPALTEPFGLTLIEAAASGLPIVATEDGGPRDIVANCHNGILIDPLEPQSISQALLSILNSPQQWDAFSQNGLRGVKEHYAWAAHAERYLTLISCLVRDAERLVPKVVSARGALYRDRMFVSSLDQNMVGNAGALQTLVSRLGSHKTSTLFVIATGRSLESAMRLMKKQGIPQPDILISSSGTAIYYASKLTPDNAWSKHIDYQWSPQRIRQILADYPGLVKQAKTEQTSFKISYLIDPKIADVEAIKRLLHQEEQSVNVQVSFGQYLDILPMRASKGSALRYVAERWQIPLERVFVAGGSGSDEDMMRGNTLATVVANRHQEELSQLVDNERIYFASLPYEAGILEALEYYDFFGECKAPEAVLHE